VIRGLKGHWFYLLCHFSLISYDVQKDSIIRALSKLYFRGKITVQVNPKKNQSEFLKAKFTRDRHLENTKTILNSF
jgi:hypothetical protein